MGTMQAANQLTATPTIVNLNCNVPGSTATVVIKPVATLTTTTIAVSAATPLPTQITLTAPASQILSSSNQAGGLTYTVALAASVTSCAGLPASVNFNFKAGTTTDVQVTVTFGNQLSASPATVSVNCDPAGNTATASITLRSVATLTTNTIAVGTGALPSQLSVTASGGTTLSSGNQTVTYTVGLANGVGCANLPPSAHFNFTAGGATDIQITVNFGTVGFAVSPTLFTLTCTKRLDGTYIPGPAQSVAVTATTAGGATVPFTVDLTSAAGLSATPANGNAGSTATSVSLVAAAGCGGYAVNTSNTLTVNIKDSAAGESSVLKAITVVLKILSPTPLSFSPAAPSLTYVKGSGQAGKVVVSFASINSPAPFMSVNPASLPSWLAVDSLSGNVPKSITFSSTSLADALAPGTYSATIAVQVSGYADLSVPISMLITNKAPTLTISGGNTRQLTWTQGNSAPAPVITVMSSDSPIPYTITTGGPLQPTVTNMSGLAYNFGTQIPISFNPVVFASAQPGSTLTGTVSFSWGSPSTTTVVTFNVSVQAAGATISGVNPAGLPTAPAGQTFQVVLTGTGFVPGTDPLQKTRVGVVIGGVMQTDTNIASNVLNSSNMILTITVPSTADPNLPFSPTGNGGTVTLGVCNPNNGTCATPTSTVSLTIGNNPIIQSVTSASTFAQVVPPALPTVAPYDMISVFGTNFCTSGGTGCASNTVLSGTPSATTMQYPMSLTPDSNSTPRLLSVNFYQHGSTANPVAAPLLFATNGQINLVVPSAVAGYGTADIVVSFGAGSSINSSAAFPVTVAAADPGMFTVGMDGQGPGAILDTSWNIVAGSNPAGMRSTGTDSDIVQLYMTGLGVPDSGSTSTGNAYPDHCVSPTAFLGALNFAASSSLTNLDGVVMQSSILSANQFVPCLVTAPTVTVGGQPATVKYAGWVADTVAGLYQVNIQLPPTTAQGGVNGGKFTTSSGAQIASISTPVQLPVVVTVGGVSSQAGVTMWVAPKLKVMAPVTQTGTVGVQWVGNGASAVADASVAASEGQAPYTYALTSGLLPAGLMLNTSTGEISGVPAANTAGSYTVTVSATDSNNSAPLAGSVTFTVTVQGGLFMTQSVPGPFNFTFGSAQPNFVQVTATGGAYPYTYTLTSPSPVPTRMALSSSGQLSLSAQTPAGTYPVTISAADSSSTPLSGTANFTVVQALNVTYGGSYASVTGSSGGALTTALTVTGNTGAVSFAAANGTPNWAVVDASTGAVTINAGAPSGAHTITVVASDGGQAPGSTAGATGTIPLTFTLN